MKRPAGWSEIFLTEVLQPNDNGKPFQQGWSPQCNKVPASTDAWGVLKTTSIQPGGFIAEENKALPSHLKARPHLEVRSGDLLITCAGPRQRCGIVCFVESTRPKLLLSGKMYRFRPLDKAMHPKFLLFFLQSSHAQAVIDKMKTGISDSGLNLTHDRFGLLELPVPPRREQDRIVAKIEELFSELDKGVESLKAAREQLRVMREAVLKSALAGRLTESGRERSLEDTRSDSLPESPVRLPKGWKTSALAEVIELPPSNGRSVKDLKGGFPVLRLTALRHGQVDVSEKKEGAWTRKEALPFLVKDGDFLLSRGNGSKRLVGRGGLVREPKSEVAFPDTMIRIRPKQAVMHPEFLALQWQSRQIRDQIEEAARTTAGIYKINQRQLSGFAVICPPLTEQAKIVRIVEATLSDFDSLSAELEAYLQHAAVMRQSILQKAFSGQLVPQNPNDEPASVLLERARVEKANAGSPRKPRKLKDAA